MHVRTLQWCRVLLVKLTGLQLVKKFPAFHGTRRFITALTSLRHLSLSWASPIQSIYPHITSWRSILILSTHLRLGLPSGLFPSGFPTKTLYTPLSSPIRATCPAHFILLDFILLGPNILLNTMFSNTLGFLSSRNVNYQVWHPYKTTGKIIVPHYIKCEEHASLLLVVRCYEVQTGKHNSTEHLNLHHLHCKNFKSRNNTVYFRRPYFMNSAIAGTGVNLQPKILLTVKTILPKSKKKMCVFLSSVGECWISKRGVIMSV